MDTVRVSDLPTLFQGVADIFEEQKDHLCEMDAAMGDGDLGLTMSKGYGALPGLIKDHFGSYRIAFAGITVCFAISCVILERCYRIKMTPPEE